MQEVQGASHQASSRFACLGSHPSLANWIGFTFEVIAARCQIAQVHLRLELCIAQSRLQPSSKLILDAMERSEAAKL